MPDLDLIKQDEQGKRDAFANYSRGHYSGGRHATMLELQGYAAARSSRKTMPNMKPNALIYGARYHRMMVSLRRRGFLRRGLEGDELPRSRPGQRRDQQGSAGKPQRFRWHP